MKISLDMQDVKRDVADNEIVKVNAGMFGVISVNQFKNHGAELQNAIDTIGFKHIRWPGGTISEEGTVSENGRIYTQKQPNMPYAYSVEYDDFIHPSALQKSTGEGTGIMGLREALEKAHENGSSFSFVIPTERYGADAEKAQSDALAALEKVFIQYVAEGVKMPANIIVDIGNENFDTDQYAEISLAILQAVKEFRETHPDIEFKIALQSMHSGQKNIDFIAALDVMAKDKSVFGEIDIVRIHDLKQTFEESLNMEYYGAKFWALKRIVEYIEGEARDSNPNKDFNLDLYFSAWSVLSESSDPVQIHGLRAAGTVLSQFTGMLALGADYAAIWGVASRSPSNTSITSIVRGEQIYSPAAATLRLMSDSIIGTKVIDTQYDSINGKVNIFAFKDDSKAVIFAAANDISGAGEWVHIDLRGLGSLGYAWGVNVLSDGGGSAIVSQTDVQMKGTVLSFKLTEDFEVARIIIARENPGMSALELVGTFRDDQLKGGGGNDSLIGQGGDDSLVGSSGKDSMDGGDGGDVLDMSALYGAFSVNLDQGQVRYGQHISVVRNIENVEGNNSRNNIVGSESQNRLFGLRGDDTIDGRGENDRVFGGHGDDLLFGGTGFDRLRGGMGQDSLFGDDNDDVLRGGGGSDVLYGGEGNDILIGGKSRDQMAGGLGADTFVIRTDGARDTILDFVSSEGDRIRISGLSHAEIMSFLEDLDENCIQTDLGTIVKFTEHSSVYLDGVDPSTLTESSFIWV